VGRARLITALGILRPKANKPGEAISRARFTDVLRTTLNAKSDALLLQESLLAAYELGARTHPQANTQIWAKYRAAEILYKHNRFDDAGPRLAEIVKKHPGTPQARNSVPMVTRIIDLEKDPEKANRRAEELRGISWIGRDPRLRAKLTAIIARARFQLIDLYSVHFDLREQHCILRI